MLGTKIEEIFQEEFDRRTEDLQTNLEYYQKELSKARKQLLDYEEKNKELIKAGREFEQVKVLKSLATKDSIDNILETFGLKTSGLDIGGMDWEDTALWFKLFVKFYPDKDRLFGLLEFFNIDFPNWAKNVKMPYDYNDEELSYVIKHADKISIANSCYFERNMGFFARSIISTHGDIKKILNTSWSQTIPWQLLFMNPLLKEDKHFNEVLKFMKSSHYNKERFFKMTSYQGFSEEQILKIADFLPPVKKMYDIHKDFIKRHSFILRDNPHFAELYKGEMTDSSYSPFNYKKFPILMQINFIKQQGDLSRKVGMIQGLEISKEDKLKLINEVSQMGL